MGHGKYFTASQSTSDCLLKLFLCWDIFVADIMCLDLQLHGGFWILKIVSVEYRELQM